MILVTRPLTSKLLTFLYKCDKMNLLEYKLKGNSHRCSTYLVSTIHSIRSSKWSYLKNKSVKNTINLQCVNTVLVAGYDF